MLRQINLSSLLVLFCFLLSCSKDNVIVSKACFTAAPDGIAGQPVQFSSDCSVNALSYVWDFGDGGSSTEANPIHTFAIGNDYTVKLTITSAENITNEFTAEISIAEPERIGHIGDINKDETWAAGVHVIFGFVNVKNATLTIEPGAVIRFMEGAVLRVGTQDDVSQARLIAEGTADRPILFTADSQTPVPGFWESIVFGKGDAGNSSLKHCIIEYGGNGTSSFSSMIYGNVSIENSTLRHALRYGASGNFTSFNNNTISDCGRGVLNLEPNWVASIGENNNFISENGGIAVAFGHIDEEELIWKKQSCPYIIFSDILVGSPEGSTWTVEPGVTIKFEHQTYVRAGGFESRKSTINFVGTAEEPITITSAKENPQPGDWAAFVFGEWLQPSSIMKHCNIEYGGSSTRYSRRASILLQNAAMSFENVKISNGSNAAFSLDETSYFHSFIDNEIVLPGSNGVELHPNWVHTIGRGNSFEAARGIFIRRGKITHPAVTWLKQPCPYFIAERVSIGSEEGSVLTIEPGNTISMGIGQHLYGYDYGYGSIIAEGTEAEPIVFTSGKENPAPGDWESVRITSTPGLPSVFNHCIFEYGGRSSSYGMLHVGYSNDPIIKNCIFRYSGSYGLSFQRAEPTLENNEFLDNASGDTRSWL